MNIFPGWGSSMAACRPLGTRDSLAAPLVTTPRPECGGRCGRRRGSLPILNKSVSNPNDRPNTEAHLQVGLTRRRDDALKHFPGPVRHCREGRAPSHRLRFVSPRTLSRGPVGAVDALVVCTFSAPPPRSPRRYIAHRRRRSRRRRPVRRRPGRHGLKDRRVPGARLAFRASRVTLGGAWCISAICRAASARATFSGCSTGA